MMDEAIKIELKALAQNIEFDVPMKAKTSFKVGGPADAVVSPASTEELQRVIRYVREKAVPCFVLGRGTNLLVMDGGIRGVVVDLKGLNNMEIRDCGQVFAAAGALLPKLVYFAMENSLEGMEAAAGIPGSVGGAVVMNAGAAGWEIKDVVESVILMEEDGGIKEVRREGLSFSYRKLDLADGAIVLGASFRLRPGVKETIKERINALLAERKAKQPLGLPNAGCIFKNPAAGPAGRIIDEMGLKGLQFGGARVSELHGNFIVNTGNATARDILSLVDDVMEKVYEKKGVTLEPEIKIIGELENKKVRIKP